MEENLAKQKVNERTHRYNLEVYRITFPNFICGSPTSTRTSDQDEENEVGPNGTTQEEVHSKEPWILKEKVRKINNHK